MADAAAERTTAEWLALLRERDIPCAPVNDLPDLLDDPQLRDVGMFKTGHHPSEGKLRTVRSPIRVSGLAELDDRVAPGLGADTGAVLRSVGYNDTVVERLVRAGAVRTGGT